MQDIESDFARDIERIQSINQVPLILDVCSRATEMRFVAIARVTEDRWITCAALDQIGFGLTPGDELEVQTTICNEVRGCREVIVFDDAGADEIYRHHHTPRIYGLKSYISMPIILEDGSFFGTLCAIDPEPHKVNTPETIGMFRLFARLIAEQLRNEEVLEKNKTDLSSERETAKLREEFIAVVGHDLRNPLAALDAGLRLIERKADLSRIPEVVGQMHDAMGRMEGIIANLMDFARGRLGDGLMANIQKGVDLGPVLQGVVDEIRAGSGTPIKAEVDLVERVACDPQRIGQLVSNLLANAVSYGTGVRPVLLQAHVTDGVLNISVSNDGAPIAPAHMQSLFQPFSRGVSASDNKGLGLGLYICAEIARAHGGEMRANSDEDGTTFSFAMPLRQA